MAINVNNVYQTVLLILNKEQRGYMTPLEFNKIGAQSQLEIFGTYFESLNQQLRVPQPTADYSDRVINLDEKLSIFKTEDTCTYSSGAFEIPAQFSGTSSATQTFNAVNPGLSYALSGDALALSQSYNISNVFIDDVELASTAYSISGGNLILNTQPQAGQDIVVNFYPKEFYRLGQVIYQTGALPTEELQRVDKGELYHLLSSNLTKPTTVNPIYTYENNLLKVYPSSITSGLSVNYIRRPIPPLWNFPATNPITYDFKPSLSYNFELHPSEQTELILKILLYAGVVIQNPEIIQVAASQIQQENINQKS